MLAVAGLWPSRVIALDRPAAKSVTVLLNAVLLIVVPLTAGLPGVYGENDPEPLKGMFNS